MVDLNEFKVEKCPQTVFYIPNFITQEEEEYLMRNIYDSPKPKWTQLKNRRLQNWGGIPHPKGMISENIPNWLNTYCNKIGSLNIFDNKIPNHILINEYEAGQGSCVFILISF
jgi:alkylated DNA repair protein alkB family protein 6